MFPIAILIATTEMASGVRGAPFFLPLFIVGVGLPLEVAIATGLITEVFGFASGLYSYGHRRAATCLVKADGEQICSRVCNRTEGLLIGGGDHLFV
jgi:hypothetical protein